MRPAFSNTPSPGPAAGTAGRGARRPRRRYGIHGGAHERLYTEEMGEGEPSLVFLHGIAGTTRYWTPRIWPLAVDHHLITVDLLGFGKSRKPWTRYSVDRHVRELHETIGDWEAVVLVGHSFGAIVAIAYAAAHPTRVRGLVLMSLPVFENESAARRYFGRRPWPESWVFGNMLFAAVACMATRRLLRRLLPLVLRDIPREVVEDLVAHTWRSFTSTLREGVYRGNVREAVQRLPADLPVACLHGDRDDTAPLSDVLALQRATSGWSLTTLKGVDHHPILRDSARCLRAIRRFVNGRIRPSQAVLPQRLRVQEREAPGDPQR